MCIKEEYKWDLDDKLIYKGIKLYIYREALNEFEENDISEFIETCYLVALRYKRELILNKLIG